MKDDFLHPFESAQRQRNVILVALRSVFFLLTLAVAFFAVLEDGGSDERAWWLSFVLGAVCFGGTIGIDLLTPNKKVATISAIFFGTIVGVLLTVAVAFVLDLLVTTFLPERLIASATSVTTLLKLLLGISLSYVCISVVLQTQDDFRLVIPYVEFNKQRRGPKPFILDTSAIIDARVVDVIELGVMQAPVVVPAFVIEEMQALADSGDKVKRARGRRGLDTVGRLNRVRNVEVVLDHTPTKETGVDAKILELAAIMQATVITTDSPLAQVAKIQGIGVVNVHDLAKATLPTIVIGQRLNLRVLKRGEQMGQGIGYMDDGTMVVVEDGERLIGQTLEVEIGSTIQTSAGRLVFTRPIHEHADSTQAQREQAETAGAARAAAVSAATEAKQEVEGEVVAASTAPSAIKGPRVVAEPSVSPAPRSANNARNPRRSGE